MMKRPEMGDVLRLPEDDHKRYGATGVGDACILARNLVAADAGTRFIMIAHPDGTFHSKEYDKTQKVNHYTLCREIDNCLGSLLQDLANTKDKSGRTLLEKTLIVSMGEFGRTPGPLDSHRGARPSSLCGRGRFLPGGGVKGDRRE